MAFLLGALVSQTLKIEWPGITLSFSSTMIGLIDKPAPTNDCEQLAALFIRVRAAFRFVRPSFLRRPAFQS